jgi:carbonic anhydrase
MGFSHLAVRTVTWLAMQKPNDIRPAPHPETPEEALTVLMEGNRRHQSGKVELHDHSPVGEDHVSRQMPFAAIVSCADSRVSPTLIFDVDRGNLFTSKVAGNTIDSGTLGSTEFAVKVLGVKLVMVLGHSNCGAVTAAIDVANGEASYPADEYGAIGEVVERIVPPISDLPPSERDLQACVELNAAAQATDLAERRPILKEAVEAGQIEVVAAVYDLETGGVSLL